MVRSHTQGYLFDYFKQNKINGKNNKPLKNFNSKTKFNYNVIVTAHAFVPFIYILIVSMDLFILVSCV